MIAKITSFALALAAASVVLSFYALHRRPAPPAVPPEQASPASPTALGETTDTAAIETRMSSIERALGQQPTKGTNIAALTDRLSAVERSLAKLQTSFEGISLETASEERDTLFRAEDGNLKADEYFAAGKYAIAGEGYLAFLEANPDHPDAYDILKRASNSFARAGYHDKAIWAQNELMTNLGERRTTDVAALAQLEKDAGRLDDAIAHAAEAAEIATGPQQALWNKMYWAWYNQLRDGDQAGLDAYRQVQQEIIDGGFADGKLGERVNGKIEEIERNKSASSL
jgi:tetratricopeptide (TPR) repeat protein